MQIIGGFIVAYSILDIISTITIKKNVAAIHNAIDGNINDAEVVRSEEHTSELQSRFDLVCRLLLEKKK